MSPINDTCDTKKHNIKQFNTVKKLDSKENTIKKFEKTLTEWLDKI
ncbi:hypothetical protein [Mycoplasmopsis anatis]|uniref:Uncharacterized protein n=1 Tax=Mycoplasmopsis anatis 1340 TaxID=1034808 RepID=F9QDL9_9BACT|nr:hypothetical protein [Mycoplasmopsis anatis]EGS29146.1 hypothetical protein GIG_00220 [Mycoplasmopsis anatis 1340]VEU73470.1 Uncharacterised protein [Mycoplasmopsis anatis]